MMKKIAVWIIAVTFFLGVAPVFAKQEGKGPSPNQKAYEHANENAKFKRTGDVKEEDAAKAAEKASKEAEKERKKAEKEAKKKEKETEKAKKEAEKEAKKKQKEAEKEAKKMKKASNKNK